MKNTDPAPQQGRSSAAAFKVGAIALAFLIIGYQAALFTTRAARLRLTACTATCIKTALRLIGVNVVEKM